MATVAITVNKIAENNDGKSEKRKTKIVLLGGKTPKEILESERRNTSSNRIQLMKGEDGAPTLVTDRDYL